MKYASPLFIILLAVWSACGVVTETDISGDVVTLRAPGAGVVFYSDTVSFWWEEVPHAMQYEFHLASPDFANAVKVWADSTTSSNLLTATLPVGDYEWEVRALNGSYATTFSSSRFSIDSVQVADLAGQRVQVISPGTNASFSQSPVLFLWEPLAGATQYQLRLAHPGFQEPTLFWDSTVHTTQLQVNTTATGNHQWMLRALNARTASEWVTGSFVVQADTHPDLAGSRVQLLAPADSLHTTQRTLTLWWEPLDGATTYEVVIVKPNFAQTELLVRQETISASQLQVTLDTGTYQWGVRARNPNSQTDRTIHTLFIRP